MARQQQPYSRLVRTLTERDLQTLAKYGRTAYKRRVALAELARRAA